MQGSNTIAIDIETAPNPAVATPEQYALEDRQPPANYKSEEAIAKWKANDFAAWKQGLGLSPRTGRIVAAGVSFLHGDGSIVPVTHHLGHTSEQALIFFLLDAIANSPRILSYNGKAFDLPFLHYRAAVTGTRIPYEASRYTKKYDHAPHRDLYNVITDFGANRWGGMSQDNVARSFGLEGTWGSGSEVAAWVEAGDWDSVEKHLRSDLVCTYRIHQRLAEVNW